MNDIAVTDYHTAGEPFRIVTSGAPEIGGTTVLERREFARTDPAVDGARRFLVNEPRGHADMYGCFVVPPDDGDAAFGALFWHKDGFSAACGHGTIALGTWAVESGMIEAASDGQTDVVIDVPSGRVTARVTCSGGQVAAVSFRNVPSYVVARGVEVVTSWGPVRADIGYGGCAYACVPASAAGLEVRPEHYPALISAGREIKWALDGTVWAEHPSDPRLSGIYGTILFDDLGDGENGPQQRNVTIFADGEVDRSPCGSGTSARLALLADEGRLAPGQILTHLSIVGTQFLGRVTETVTAEGRAAVITEVEGNAYRTGQGVFSLDPRDPLGSGFVLR